MGEIVHFNKKQLFTLVEARRLLPIVRRVTGRSSERVKKLSLQLSYTKELANRAAIEEEIVEVFQCWKVKIRKLGCEAKGMWLVDFDSGDGYYCWRFPEESIYYFHGYYEGYCGRMEAH